MFRGGIFITTQKLIVEEIMNMSEGEAKSKLAELMINYSKIGYGSYTEEQCFKDYKDMYRDIVVREIFRKGT